MGNLRPLAVLVASALAASAIAATAATAGRVSGHTLQQIPLAKSAATAQVERAGPNGLGARRGGVNQHIRPASAADKFTAEPDRSGEDTYIVRLHDQPVATYDGRIKGYAATSKRSVALSEAQQSTWDKWLQKGKAALNLTSDAQKASKRYKNYLLNKQQGVLKQALLLGITKPVRMQYTDAINGFSVKMTQQQAAAMAAMPEVAYVQRSQLYKLNTDEGPHFIGADQIWQGQSVTGLAHQGEGMLVGIIDTGINSDHVSFAAVGDDGYQHVNPRGAGNYLGDCATGFAAMCNDKLIGVWSWPVITGIYDNDEFQAPDWDPSWMPRVMKRPANGEDYNGHGSHTAGTVAGNVTHNAPMLGSSIGDGDGVPTGLTFAAVSGVAPHANIIAYQVCYPGGGGDPYYGCMGEAILKAVDQAIQDGVDVINFSIGGSESFPWEDAAELAFLSAREAGISVAVSAGNSGSDGWSEIMQSSDHTSPWLLSVAATTHDRVLDIPAKTLGSFSGGTDSMPDITEGRGISPGYSGPIVSAAAFGDELCENPFPAGTFNNGEIVVCKRGNNGRVEKANNVAAGGAGGFVLYNAIDWGEGSDLVNDVYPIPGVHIASWDGDSLIAWLGSGSGHVASISAAIPTRTIDSSAADLLADFSSRGPSSTYEGHLVPGIAAPGVDIFAPFADEHPFSVAPFSRDWTVMSGTSMASPHVAGAMTLLRQEHPDWTPAEVQSALQMTAREVVSYQPYQGADPVPASTYRAGSGRIDVLAASNAGLVMDETASNFELANPRNGGDVKSLNLPELVNMHCRHNCVWLRTVKATRDGSWTVSAETDEYSVRLSSIPETFTLRAGESRTIQIRGEILDSQSAAGNAEQEVWGKVRLTPDDSSIPAAHWPVALKFDHGALPEALTIAGHRDQGNYRLSNLTLPKLNQVSYRGFGLTKAEVEDVTLPIDPDWQSPIVDNDFQAAAIRLVQVPAGTLRLVVENIKNLGTTAEENWRRGDADIMIGFDSNGDGLPQWEDESICYSTTESEMDFCNINRPEPGQYWVVIHNFNTQMSDQQTSDSYRIATAIVADAVSSDLQLSGPASTDGINPAALDLTYDLQGADDGDVLYGALDIGSANTPGSVGMVPLKIARGVDDVSLKTSQTRARAGELIDVSLHVVENLTGADRRFDLATTLPSGLTLVPGSVKLQQALQSSLTVTGNHIRVAGSQQNSEQWPADYRITTNRTDALCRTPDYGYYMDGTTSDGGYVDLAMFGYAPDFGGHYTNEDNFTNYATLPLAAYWGDGMSLYNNPNVSYPELMVSPQGWAAFDAAMIFEMHGHSKLPTWTAPDGKLGVIWQGDPWNNYTMGTPLGWDGEQSAGMTVAYTHDEVVVEWDGARNETHELDLNTWERIWTELDDRYDAEMILNRHTRFEDGEFEVIMAYDDIDFGTQPGNGAIGLQGFTGPMTMFGPLDGPKGVTYAFNDLKAKLSDGLVVCYDYVGPESTQFDLRFQVRVNDDVGSQDQLIHFVSQVDGVSNVNVDQLITVNGNLSIGAIPNQTVVENTLLEGIAVLYSDNDSASNTVSVRGDHVTATMHGNEPGDEFDLMPAANFEGTTEVTVTVTDNDNPADSVSTSFMLTVTKGTDVVVTPPPSNGGSSGNNSGGGGGSVAYLALLLVTAAGWRRRRSLVLTT
ncbi:S8 family serine peptidase [Permianibacter sp. IMCC34836]|uniref:S8 family serine peptidase n=1 Tax=Permianibacter fluminis TaxID=2738515 RepID=UPI00155184EB|nr:S8 family serine peptidase [Permianibacter fluminis]NQD35482.1 S8 family serine peptidase [Permianibacter fluminis]